MWAIWTQHNEISLPMSYGWISTLSTTSGKLFNAHRSFKEKTNNIWQAMQLAWKRTTINRYPHELHCRPLLYGGLLNMKLNPLHFLCTEIKEYVSLPDWSKAINSRV
jgi:hypothetical protein